MKNSYKIISILLSLLIVYFLFAQIKLEDIVRVLTEIKLGFLIGALAIYIILNLIRTERFSVLIARKIKFLELFQITSAHAFLTNILPARSGELFYVYYLRRTGQVTTGNNLSSLLVSRVLDTMAVIVFMAISLFFIGSSIADFEEVVLLTVLSLAVMLVLFLLFFFKEQAVIKLLQLLFKISRLDRLLLGRKILFKLGEAMTAVAEIRKPQLFLKTALLTLLIWILIFIIIWLISLGFGLQIDFWQAVFIGGLPTLVSIIPFYTIGGFGIFEGSSTLALLILGFTKELAIGFSFLSHVARILISAIPGLISYIILFRRLPSIGLGYEGEEKNSQ